MSNTVKVTKCDNELIILAYQFTGSYELCRIISGNNQAVNVTLNILQGENPGTLQLNGINNPLNDTVDVFLPAAGQYSLVLLGVNWGGPSQFSVNVNGANYDMPLGSPGDGLVWHPAPINFTV